MISLYSDEYFMHEALKEAEKAMSKDEVPVGCVVVYNQRIIARTHNLSECLNDVTAHAEMQAITSAANTLGGKYLVDCTVYVTLEPCPMCAGALHWAQISELVFGAYDTKRGYRVINNKMLHPKTKIKMGVLENECSQIIKAFFQNKRANELK